MPVYYIQINIFCALILVGVFFLLRGKRGVLPTRRLAFSFVLLASVLMCLSDIAAWLLNGKSFPGCRQLLEVSNMVYFAAITWTCYAWLNYVDVRIMGLRYGKKPRRLLFMLPVLVMTFFILLNPFTHFCFEIDSENIYSRGSGIILHWIITWGYMFFATGLTVYKICHTESKIERKQLRPMLWFVVCPVVAAIIQMLFYGVTVTQCGITLSALLITYESLDEQISIDNLTGLNNRHALETYISERVRLPGITFSVIICDIDRFKTINDTFGHVSGDLALKQLSDVLKSACGQCRARVFLCRYGGDEFIISGINMSETDIADLIENISGDLDKLNRRKDSCFQLSLSYGTAAGPCNSHEDFENLISQADRSMYEMKKN